MSNTAVVPAQQPAMPAHLYRVEEIAEKLGTSVSYVYAMIVKDKPKVHATHCKAFLYSDEYLEHLMQRPRRMCTPRRLQVPQQFAAKQPETIVEKPVQSTIPAHETHNKSLLERMSEMEQAIAMLKQLLGL